MTLCMAWIRTVGAHEELLFASDSRLSGGSDWDCCPKLMLLPRGDSVIGFAGSTFDAYPMMIQFRNWVETHPAALNRGLDINELKKQMRLMFNDMRLFITDLPVGQKEPDPPDCELIFGGWSWKTNQSLRAHNGRAGSVERTRLSGCRGRVVGGAYGGFYRRERAGRRQGEPVGRLKGRVGRMVVG